MDRQIGTEGEGGRKERVEAFKHNTCLQQQNLLSDWFRLHATLLVTKSTRDSRNQVSYRLYIDTGNPTFSAHA